MQETNILHINPSSRSRAGRSRISGSRISGSRRTSSSRFGGYRAREELIERRRNPLGRRLNPFWELAQEKARSEKREVSKMKKGKRRKHGKRRMKSNPKGKKITTEQVKKFQTLKETMGAEKAAKSLGLNVGALYRKTGKKGKKAGKKVKVSAKKVVKKAAKKVKAVAKKAKTRAKKARAKATKMAAELGTATKKLEATEKKMATAVAKMTAAPAKGKGKRKGKKRTGKPKGKARPKAKAVARKGGLSKKAVTQIVDKKMASMKHSWKRNPRPKEGLAMQIGTVVVSGFVARFLGNWCRNGIVRLAVPTGTSNADIVDALKTQEGFENVLDTFAPNQNIRKFFFVNASTMGQGVVFALASLPYMTKQLKAIKKVPLIGKIAPKMALGSGLNFGVSLVNLMVNKVTGKGGMTELQNLGTLILPSGMGDVVARGYKQPLGNVILKKTPSRGLSRIIPDTNIFAAKDAVYSKLEGVAPELNELSDVA